MIRIVHLREKCIGCYACVEANPERWRISRRDGKSILVEGVLKKNQFIAAVPDDELTSNLQAERNCPVNVIRILS